MIAFLWWLHHNITAGLRGELTVYMVDGRLRVEQVAEGP